jgi:RNA polymerase sigma-70 factor (ECF subfamily)
MENTPVTPLPLGSTLQVSAQRLLENQPAAPVQPGCCTPAPEQSSHALCEQVWGVWQEHSAGLRRYLQGRIRAHALTDDILSEVMLKVYKNCERLTEVKDVKAWLTRVAQNTLTDYYRTQKTSELPSSEVLAADSDAEEVLPEQRMAACLGQMLTLLAEKDRFPLQWADLEGIPQEEVARRLGISLSGAKSRIQRARLKLRQQIEACCQVETNTQGRVADFYPRKQPTKKSC